MPTPAIIFLDWDGTICRSRFWGQWQNDSKYAHLHQRIQEQFFRAAPEILTAWMRGEWATDDIIRELSRRTSIPGPKLLAGLRQSCQKMELLSPHILPAVNRLRQRGIKVVISTDNMDTFTRWTVPALALEQHFDAILNSHQLRALKRDKTAEGQSRFFGPFLARHQLAPAETLLIDDGLHNAIVTEFGMRFLHVTPEQPVEAILHSL